MVPFLMSKGCTEVSCGEFPFFLHIDVGIVIRWSEMEVM